MSRDRSDCLPVSWISAELGQLVDVHYGKALSQNYRVAEGRVPVVGSSGVVGKHREGIVHGSCIVVGRKGAAGSVHLLSESCWPIDTAYYIQPPSGISLKYLSYQLGSFDLVRLDRSTAIPSLSRDDLYRVNISVAPTAEQTRIVAKLEELLSDLDAGVAELRAAQKKLTQYRQSLLKSAVEGALTVEWRKHNKPKETGAQLLERILKERRARWESKQLARFKEQRKVPPPKGWQEKYPEPVKPDTANLPELPKGWVWATICQLTVEQKYGSSAKTNEDATGVPVIRMGNIQDGGLDLQDMKYLPVAHDEFPELHLSDGDMLFNRTNSPELVGKSAIYRSQIVPCSYASYLIAVRFVSLFVPELAAAYINSAYGKSWVKSVVVQQVGQANVNGTKLAALSIPLPPFEEQKAIVQKMVWQIENAITYQSSIETSLMQSTAQRKNILKAAFSGQLVPQDPNDGPVSVLLESIRAERLAKAQSTAKRAVRKRA